MRLSLFQALVLRTAAKLFWPNVPHLMYQQGAVCLCPAWSSTVEAPGRGIGCGKIQQIGSHGLLRKV